MFSPSIQALARRELALRELARRMYRHYLAYVNAPAWRCTRMSAFLAEELQQFLETQTDNAYDILVLETPPQHGKSWTLTEALPSWWMGKHPETRVILASYNEDSAVRFARRNREKLQLWGENLFGISLGGMNRGREFELAGHRGRLISRGILAGITGHPADLLIIDDPIKNREEADSPAYREKLWGEWVNSLKSRLQANAKVIVIMTPWHEDDLAARILATEEHVRLIRLPVEAEADDPLGRAPGEPLCPELGKGAKWLEQFKRAYLADPMGGARAWSALYQCSPRVEGGNLIHRDWWRFYRPEDIQAFGTTVISVDAAFKDADHHDFVAIQVWGKRKQDYFLRYSLNQHLDFPATLQAIRAVRRLYPDTQYVLVEDKANGSAIIQTLDHEMLGVIGINPQGGKVSRVNAVASAIESGHVYLPQDASWVAAFVDQFTAFPAGAHDDMVDAASQCLHWLIWSNGAYEPLSEVERRRIEQEDEARERLTSNAQYDELYGDTWW